jgi:hypothetical protein
MIDIGLPYYTGRLTADRGGGGRHGGRRRAREPDPGMTRNARSESLPFMRVDSESQLPALVAPRPARARRRGRGR